MKSSHAALVVVGLALVGLWYAAGGPVSPHSTAEARVSEPVSHENLTVFFVHGPDAITGAKIMTLQEALETGRAVVHETGEVNSLAVENLSADYELFIQDGDMIRGGKQDRLIAIDMLVPPRSGKVPFPAHCVESGRWTGRGNEDAKQFNKSDQFAVGNDLRYANATRQQGEVWKNVKVQQDKLSANLKVKVNAAESESSLQLALENRAVQTKVAEFERALLAAGETRENVVGVVFVLNGEVYGHEEYGSNELFRKAWPKLLRAAAANAVAEKPAKAEQVAQATPSTRQIERYLAYAGQGQPAANESSGQSVTGLYDRLYGVTTRTEIYAPRRAQDGVIMAGSGAGRIDEQRLRQLAETWGRLEPPDRTRTAEELLRQLPARYRPMVEDYFRALNRTNGQNNDDLTRAIAAIRREQSNDEWAQAPNAAPNPGAGGAADVIQEVADLLEVLPNRDVAGIGNRVATPQPANVPGNRLNVNRVDGAAGLVTESRDPARQNAVIHKSFIKK